MEPRQRIREQILFLTELDRLKSVVRQSPLADRSRKENSAEHSWHLAMFALVLAEHADGIDASHVVKLLLVHDIVEIDAGDTPIHIAGVNRVALQQAERAAAERIFGLLPSQQGKRFLDLWTEFEAGTTREARFARALDRLQPLLLNVLTDGGTWTENDVSEEQVLERYGPAIRGGSELLWDEARDLVRIHFEAKRLPCSCSGS